MLRADYCATVTRELAFAGRDRQKPADLRVAAKETNTPAAAKNPPPPRML
jgi:hypothetical protein